MKMVKVAWHGLPLKAAVAWVPLKGAVAWVPLKAAVAWCSCDSMYYHNFLNKD